MADSLFQIEQRIGGLQLHVDRLKLDVETKTKMEQDAQTALGDFDQRLTERNPNPTDQIKADRKALERKLGDATDAKKMAEQELARTSDELAELEETAEQYRQMGLDPTASIPTPPTRR